jgi:hypothetical protein
MDSQAELELLNSLYGKLRQYKNFFQPTMKLIEKIREGGKIHRKYDEPRTPYCKAERHGPGIELNHRRAHAIWMQQMLGKEAKKKALRMIGPVSPGVRVEEGLVPTAFGANPSHRPWTSAWARPLADNLNLSTRLHALAAGLLFK